MFCQCQHCEVWHTLAANNPAIYEEIRYDRSGEESAAADSGDSAGTVLGADGGGGGDGDESR